MVKSNFKKLVYLFLIIFVLLQFVPTDQTNPVTDPKLALENVEQIDASTLLTIKLACYDCHSNETRYPWYAHVAPFSFMMNDHINEGRDELNFSVWGSYSPERREHKLEEIAEEVEEGEMPLTSYKWLHADARLSDEQREQIAHWAESLVQQ